MAGQLHLNYPKTEEWVNTGTKEIMVFYPTIDEMKDFSAYVEKCEDNGAVQASGICKIVSPSGWSPRPNLDPTYDDILDYSIKDPVKEVISKRPEKGAYFKENIVYKSSMSVKKFRELALSPEYSNPKPETTLQELERYFWRNIVCHQPLYGADTPGSCYEESVSEFNVSKLGTILDLLKDVGIGIAGVTSAYLYFGMWKSSFAWHVEDADLYSINYLHFGEPKFWYAVSSDYSDQMEKLFKSKFMYDSGECDAYLRHKTFIVSVSELTVNKIPYGTMVQWPGEFIITFPKGYHMGFNLGYNCAESTNFALDRWIDYGKNAIVCRCQEGAVEVDVRPFMKKYRPDEFESWHNYWYGEGSIFKRPTEHCKPTLAKLPIVDLPMIKNDVMDAFIEQVAEARTDFNFLWHHQNDFKEECLFNKAQGKLFPHCSICQFLVPQNDKECKSGLQSESTCYTTDELYEKNGQFPQPIKFKSSRLVSCRRCFVVVHADCMNLEPSDLDTSNDSENAGPEACPPTKKRRHNWICKRCEFAREELVCAAISCDFCGPIRGGALIPHNPDKEVGKFVHVICAIMSRRTKIVRSENSIYAKSMSKNWLHELCRPIPPWQELDLNREYLVNEIELFLNTNPNRKLNCELCKLEIVEHFVKCQTCHHMEVNPIYFHASCAYFAHLTLEYRDFPALMVAVCPCHTQTNKNDESELKISEQVVFMGPQNKPDMVQIVDTRSSSYCHVDFFDDAFSDDVSLDDIIDCECKHIDCNGQHVPSWIVTVRWEESIFQGYVRQFKSDIAYTVKSLKSNESFICSRMPLYRLDDQQVPELVARAIESMKEEL